MATLYVCDTCALIEFFGGVFRTSCGLSNRAYQIIDEAVNNRIGDIRLSVPSTVFLEIFDKWLTDEESVRRFYYEVFIRLRESPNVEIKPIERDVIVHLLELDGAMEGHDMHDKIILASAMMLECSLITSDKVIRTFNLRSQVIPEVFY